MHKVEREFQLCEGVTVNADNKLQVYVTVMFDCGSQRTSFIIFILSEYTEKNI